MAVSRRLMREQRAEEKLGLIVRLQRRYVECRLPQESESRVEQSFNEQLFARVLGYRTLFSHDALPYHLRPKNYAGRRRHKDLARRRYDDFSLGMFWGDKRDVVVASAEFKDPGMNLDAPQTDRKEKISAVAQAFRTAAGFQGCLWILVSNFRELRLYHAQRSEEPLVSLDLHEIRTPRQLAVLCAHFDFDALVGNRGTSEMSTMLNSKHPSAPISALRHV